VNGDDDLTEEQRRSKEAFIAARGYWRPWTDDLLRLDPDFLDAYGRYAGYPSANGPLTRRMVELVYVALDCSATHMFGPGAELHINLALEAGATPRDISDVLKLATAQGLTGTFAGIGILAEELAAASSAERELTAAEAELRHRYSSIYGDWPSRCDHMLKRNPAFFASMLDMVSVKDDGKGLSATEQTLIRIALAGCFTALDREALRAAIRHALVSGVDVAEIEQVLLLTAHLGVHACTIGFPALRKARKESIGLDRPVSQG
jgi:alkylhydroperoxidase/carboxymuconolactone decarboxylase family protein YurZ